MAETVRVRIGERWYDVEVGDLSGNPIRVTVDRVVVEVDTQLIGWSSRAAAGDAPSPAPQAIAPAPAAPREQAPPPPPEPDPPPPVPLEKPEPPRSQRVRRAFQKVDVGDHHQCGVCSAIGVSLSARPLSKFTQPADWFCPGFGS